MGVITIFIDNVQGLSKRQQQVADFIETFIQQHRHSPSYREIQHHFGFSSLGSVYSLIQILKRKGILADVSKGARSLNLHAKNPAFIEVPLIGKLREGMPIITFPQFRQILFPSHMIPNNAECYLLQVEGEELIDECMRPGDLILVQPKSCFENGETIIALIGEHTTLIKQAFSEPPHVRLESANPHIQSSLLRQDHVHIQGVVIRLFRNY